MNKPNFSGDDFAYKAEGYPVHSHEDHEYFEELDRRFFESSRRYVPYRSLPFETEIPFDVLPNLDVLEIGVGQGSHAGLIAPRVKSFTDIDLTEPAANPMLGAAVNPASVQDHDQFAPPLSGRLLASSRSSRKCLPPSRLTSARLSRDKRLTRIIMLIVSFMFPKYRSIGPRSEPVFSGEVETRSPQKIRREQCREARPDRAA